MFKSEEYFEKYKKHIDNLKSQGFIDLDIAKPLFLKMKIDGDYRRNFDNDDPNATLTIGGNPVKIIDYEYDPMAGKTNIYLHIKRSDKWIKEVMDTMGEI